MPACRSVDRVADHAAFVAEHGRFPGWSANASEADRSLLRFARAARGGQLAPEMERLLDATVPGRRCVTIAGTHVTQWSEIREGYHAPMEELAHEPGVEHKHV